TALTLRLFGKESADLIPLLNEGARGMAAAAEEADALGQVIGSKTAKAAEQFNDNLSRAGMLASGFGNELAAKLLPALVGVTDEFIRSEKESRSFETAANAVADVLKFVGQVAIVTKGAIEALTNLLAAAFDTIDRKSVV